MRTQAGTGPSYAVVDVETTGLDARQYEIVEVAVVLTDGAGDVVWEWASRVRPQGPMSATHVHGLTESDVAAAPPFGELLPWLSSVLAGRVLAAHNASFDLRFLRAEYHRAGWDLPALPVICTRDAGRAYLPGLPSWRLPDCCTAAGVAHHDAHSALGDARAAAGLLHAYLTRTPDRGAGLGWYQAWQQAACVDWPTAPSHPPVVLPVRTITGGPRPAPTGRRAQAARVVRPARATPPLRAVLTRLAPTLPLASALERGAPASALAYLELVTDAMADGILTPDERDQMQALARAEGLSEGDVAAAHRAFLVLLTHAALIDGRVTRAERAELGEVARLLDVDPTTIPGLLKDAERSRTASLSQDLPPLPPDWSLGEPLRVGDRISITGCDGNGRDDVVAQAERAGVRVTGSVSRFTAFLVSDGTVTGTKHEAAIAHGTRIVSPQDALVLLAHVQPATS